MKIDLSTPFLYQNPTTGAASSTTLSCTQLCRLLCPAVSAAAKRAATTSIVSPSSRILAFDAAAQSYDAAGWQLANSVDVLGEACDEWYYEARANNNNKIEGPVSARALSKLYYQQDSSVTAATRVYRNSTSAQQQSKQAAWMQIDQLDNLKLAIEAFRDVVGMPSSASWTEKDQTAADDANHTYDNYVDQMTFDNGQEPNNNGNDKAALQQQNVADELEAFLSSTDHLAPHTNKNNDTTEEDQEEYESDGGTRYIRDTQTGNWIHEALMMQQRGESQNISNNKKNEQNQNNTSNNINDNNIKEAATTKKRKRKKPKFSAKSARNWIYITGLPLDTTEEELSTYFSKVGIIDIDPETLKPKIKLYRHKKQPCSSKSGQEDGNEVGQLKGDASICYARPESVELALQILDENLFRDGAILSVQRAKFEQHGSAFDADKAGKGGVGKRRMISESKRRVARLAAIQAVGWDESENGRIAGGLKGLRIIALMNMFDPRELDRDDDTNEKRLQLLEQEIHSECEKSGTVEKITIFSKHPAGVAIVKFIKPNDASDAVKALNGKVKADGKRIEASFWDGTTDYTVVDTEREEKEDAKRLDQFGDWLEEQDLPEEFQLRVEGS